MMEKGNLSRRGFIQRSLAGLTVGAGLPLWYAREVLAHELQTAAQNQQPVQANDRIVMAAIGTGTNRTRRTGNQRLNGERGYQIMRDAMGQRGVQMVAVCDVDRPNAEFAAQAAGRDCQIFADFRRLLENRDIQAVTIGTPDHWHAIVAIAAMRAGKQVYCEKPLTLFHSQGQAMVRVSNDTHKILQTGSQQRSDTRFRLACELVRNGRIGRISRIETRIGDNPVGGPFRAAPVPDGLDWNFWQGPTPQVEYVPQRCHYDFRWWYEYSGGKMTDWGAHHNDIAQWALGMDASGPVEVWPNAERTTAPSSAANSYNCHPRFEVHYRYNNNGGGNNGTELVCMSNGENGIRFEGENNQWIFVSRGVIRASDGNQRESRIIGEPLPQTATRLEVSNNHMGNFIACVRGGGRTQPICNVTVGHRSVSVCHIGTIAIRTGLRLRWDPAREVFTGDNAEQANAMLTRPYRAPWRLEA
jgi:myo-inositol 2-dehydrogenase / D-chiro-inositol 1-dehydrogenase